MVVSESGRIPPNIQKHRFAIKMPKLSSNSRKGLGS
jgi:hypothetical protein